jgi:hypothetical protein
MLMSRTAFLGRSDCYVARTANNRAHVCDRVSSDVQEIG